MKSGTLLVAAFAAAASYWISTAGAEQDWPAPVAGIQPSAAGEHPRLLFRKADVAKLREKAKTPEGQAILKRLRETLDGKNGDTFPKVANKSGHAYQGNTTVELNEAKADNGVKNSNKNVGKSEGGGMPLGTYSFSHAAGYGLLYQLTGEKKYADLGRQAFETAWKGVRDRDDRYSWRTPGGALRSGPTMGWYALGYDLCYDGWDATFREQAARELSDFPGDRGNKANFNNFIENCIAGKRQHPGSNHWGMEVGGSAMALMALWQDPGADMEKFKPLWEVSQKCMVANMTRGFGDGGFFAEGDGTGSMSSHIVFLQALQAWRTGFGKDFITPAPNAQWMANRWFLQTISLNGKASYQPQRGGYPHNIWARSGLSGGGYFSTGFGVAANDDVKAAILWYYEKGGFMDADAKNGTPYDTPSPYPHHSVLSFVNWPVGLKPKNPAGIIPNAVHDSKFGFYLWRDKWDDESDVVISILSKTAKGNMSAAAESTLSINQGGKVSKWGNLKGGFKGEFKPARNGSTVLQTAEGDLFAVDFSGASGASALIIATGTAAGKGDFEVTAGGKKVSILSLGKGKAAEPKTDGNTITMGGQTITVDGEALKLAK